MDNRFETTYEVGQDTVRKLGLELHNPVFFVSAILMIVFVVGALTNPAGAKKALDGSKLWIINHFDWFFVISCNIFVLFCLVMIVLPFGRIRLGELMPNPILFGHPGSPCSLRPEWESG